MTRTRVRYRCTECGYEATQWLGRCTDCGEWGSFGEAPVGATGPTTGGAPSASLNRPVPISEIDPLGAPRRPTRLAELDRVLDGGLVTGSVTLIGGEPGMGKSTLLLQALGAMAAAGARCLLVCGEESPAQVRLRADRLGTLQPGVLIVAETSLPAVCAHVEELRPDVLAIDSIQTVQDPDSPGAAGSVAQVRDGAQRLVRLAKDTGIATLLVGGAEPVLQRAQHAQRVMPVAFERQHRVDDVLQHTRTGQRAVFRDVADHDRRETVVFREPDQSVRAIAHLRDRTGCAAGIGIMDRLDRVDREDGRLQRVDVRRDRGP